MSLKRIGFMLMLMSAVLGVLLACGLSSVPFISQAEPTATRRPTRVVRPTFTPRPAPTDTAEPEPTEEPTEELPTEEPTERPTRAPTRAPTRRPTARPVQPTNPPEPPPPPEPTKSPFAWKFANVTCEHSGGTYIHIRAYSDRNNPNSTLAGIRTRLSWASGDGEIGTEETRPGDGYSTFVLSGDGQPAATGTYFAWIVDKDGNRLSEVSAPINITGGKPDAAGTCWKAFVNFVRN
jgi:hypothetical protein